MTISPRKNMKHLDDAWLMIVAQTTPLKQADVFNLLVAEGKYKSKDMKDKRKFDLALRFLVRQGFLRRQGIKWHFKYYFDDDCLLRPVSSLSFTKAVECHIFTLS